jgi:DNA-binding CsgD family transcriptional regulator
MDTGQISAQEDLHVRALLQALYGLVSSPRPLNEAADVILAAVAATTRAARCYLMSASRQGYWVHTRCAALDDAAPYHAGLSAALAAERVLPQRDAVLGDVWISDRATVLMNQRCQHREAVVMWSMSPPSCARLGIQVDPGDETDAARAYQAEVLSLAATHLSAALRARAHFQGLVQRRAMSSQALACLPYGVVIVDAEGWIVEANPRAEDSFAADGPLRAAQGALVTAHEDDAPKLRAALSEAGQTDQPVRWLCRGASPQSAWEVKVTAKGSLRCVEVHDRAPRDLAQVMERACALYRVTPSERRVLRLLAQGVAAWEVAATLGLTEGTVNQYAHRLFGKLGVHSQRELICFLENGLSSWPLG